MADDSPEHLTAGGEGALLVVVASRGGTPLDVVAVTNVLKDVPGVTAVENAEGEGHGTLGFRLRFGVEDPRRALFETVVKHDLMLLEVRRTQASLEDTFRKLTGQQEPRKAA